MVSVRDELISLAPIHLSKLSLLEIFDGIVERIFSPHSPFPERRTESTASLMMSAPISNTLFIFPRGEKVQSENS